MSPLLHCIDLDQPALTGFRSFISSWLVQTGNLTLLVDPGPLSTIPHLIAEVEKLGIDRVDYILLTHIHIDHAGGTGRLLERFPSARVICHPEGIRHMVAPEKLWQGSLKVLGKTAEAYGEIVPVPEGQIGWEETLEGGAIRSFFTPGHAQHHCCYMIGNLLIAGEVAGVRCPVWDGISMRPATPPKFLLPVALDSLDRMIALEPERMIFAHYGLDEDAPTSLKDARSQLLTWVDGVRLTLDLPEEEREEAFFQWLLANDPLFAPVQQLPADLLERERIFFGNSFRGMHEYVLTA